MMRTPLLALAAAAACVLATARTADAAVVFNFDQDGPGVTNGSIPIVGLNLSAGNAAAIGGNSAVSTGVGSTFQLYVQVQVGNLIAPNGGVIPIQPGQLTAVASITERVTSVSGGTATFEVAPVQAANSGLRLYANNVANTADNFNGTGFITGNPILTANAIVSPQGSLNTFTSNGGSVAFDQSPVPNAFWNSQRTVNGSGVSTVDFAVTSTDPAFFTGGPSPAIISLHLGNAGANVPFTAVNPSRQFTNPFTLATVTPDLGAINGNLNAGLGRVGPDFQFQVSGTVTAVPEPTSVVLMGLGVAGLLVVARRKRTQVD